MEAESYPMKGGEGTYSYTKNSCYQREATNVAKTMIEESIRDKLDISTSKTFRMADLGCSVGPNTFICMENIIKCIEKRYKSTGSQVPVFQVFFNDHILNDFNTLFVNLPAERNYYAAGVPGSFHGRLFPESSLNFVHSSYALQWLSKVPEKLVDNKSNAWNKGKIYYTSAPVAVANAYAAQFGKDMEVFLSARAKEMVSGGMMVVTVPSLPEGINHSEATIGVMFDLLGSTLMDMAREEIFSEDTVDSFNIPLYLVPAKEMAKLIEKNGSFTIEKLESSKIDAPLDARSRAMHLRAVTEGVIAKHFGSEIMDKLFQMFFQNAEENSNLFDSSSRKEATLILVLKRK